MFSYSWKTGEFSHKFSEPTWRWFWGILLSVGAIYAVATNSMLFLVIVAMIAGLLTWQQFAKPKMISVKISQDEITVDNKTEKLSDFEGFSIEKTVVRNILYFVPKDKFGQALHFPIGEDVEVDKLADDLQTVLKEEAEVSFLDKLYRSIFP